MGASFKLFGHGLAENLLATTSSPFVGLMIGMALVYIAQHIRGVESRDIDPADEAVDQA